MTQKAPVRAQLLQLGRIARAVLNCPDVLQLHPGPTGRITSATTTGRVVGLLFQGRTLTVGVITQRNARTEDVVTSIREAVAPMVPDTTSIAVVVSSARLREANF